MGHFVAACRRRVVYRFAQGAGKRFLRWTGPLGRRVLKFDGPLGRGLRIALSGNTYKVSVTGFTFSVIWYDKHSADWLAALATPYPAAPDFPLCRGQNKTPRNIPFISCSTVSTGYSAPLTGEWWWRQPPKGENAFPRPSGRL